MDVGSNDCGDSRRYPARRLLLGVIPGIALTLLLIVWLGTEDRSAVTRESAVTQESAAAQQSAVPQRSAVSGQPAAPRDDASIRQRQLQPRQPIDASGYSVLIQSIEPWEADASLQEIGRYWDGAADRLIQRLDRQLASLDGNGDSEVWLLTTKAMCLMSDGKPEEAYAALQDARSLAETREGSTDASVLSSLVYFQGVAALRRGENENCILCRGESSCIIPINAAAIHQQPEGSRLAIQHFTEYLQQFPDDLEVRWLLNVAHMTLGEHPDQVDPRFLVPLDRFVHSEVDIGRFRDIGHLVGVNRLNQSGGAIMEDFDNDGLLDLAVSSFDPLEPLGLYRNMGDGRFTELAKTAGVDDQFGGLNCVQTDYNNDGLMDIYIPRGAWLRTPIRPSLLRNDGQFRFTDVTEEAGLLDPVNSNAAMWADYDNDGWLDLFVCCERQLDRLYRNLGNGKFAEVGSQAGVAGAAQSFTKGCAWIDYDNDNYPDLFVSLHNGPSQLYHNDQDGTFSNVTQHLGIDGPSVGFSCWAWDYNNDGWLDLFATSFERSLEDVVKGLVGQPHELESSRLYLNQGGTGFKDVTRESGLDMCFSAMGSNYGDFDNDGFLDMYLGTGEPDVTMLVPNRMFKNLSGERFAEITGSAGVGHLQKGHGVACGDWDRDGNVDVFIQMGGAINGDKYHNILFQNPGHENHWLTVRLVGQRTNRAALGARIKVVTAGEQPLTIYRHVSSGSSFGGSPLEQTIGLADAERIAELEIHWPTSGTTQVFRDLAVNQAIEATEFADDYRILDLRRVPLPQ